MEHSLAVFPDLGTSRRVAARDAVGAMTDPDGDLVARAGAGDRAAAEELVGRHLPKMLTLARRMLAEPAEAEDAVQETFLKLWTHAPRWKPGRARFETWLYRVTLNACYDRLRRRRTVPLEDAEHVVDETGGPDEAHWQNVTSAHVRQALGELPGRQRAAIVLCHFDGLGNIRAAEAMGISVEALESLLARGRRMLKQRLSHLKD